MIDVSIDTKVFNDSFRPLYADESDVLVCMGGAGSGKSDFMVTKLVFRSIEEQGLRVPLVRKTARSLRDSVFQMFKDVISRYNLSNFFEFNETFLRIYNKYTDSLFYGVGLDNVEKIKSLAAPNNMFIEEASELSYDDWVQLTLRIRGKRPIGCKYKQIMVAFNPVNKDNWTRKEFFPESIDDKTKALLRKRVKLREKEPNKYFDFSIKDVAARFIRKVKVGGETIQRSYTIHRSNYYDNRFLEPSDRAAIEGLISQSENAYRVYRNAEWGTVGNLVFETPFPILRSFPEHFDDVFYGMDFGYHHPTALVEIGVKDGWYYVKELLYLKKKNKSEIIEEMKSRDLIKPDSIIYCDNAEPDTIDMLNNAGYNAVGSIKGNNSVREGNEFLKTLKIFSHIENVNLNREMWSYRLKVDREGKPIDGVPVPEDDDCISALRYAITTQAKIQQVKTAFI